MNKKDRKEQQETIAKWKKRSQRLQTALRLTLLVLTVCSSTMPIAFANSALDSINNLSDFIFSALKAIGMIILGFGVLQVGLSIQSHDASQRSQGFLCVFGGLSRETQVVSGAPLFPRIDAEKELEELRMEEEKNNTEKKENNRVWKRA